MVSFLSECPGRPCRGEGSINRGGQQDSSIYKYNMETMGVIRVNSDRTVDSTDNNEFADGMRDETMIPDNLIEIISIDEEIPEALDEAEVGERPLYDEAGLRDNQ